MNWDSLILRPAKSRGYGEERGTSIAEFKKDVYVLAQGNAKCAVLFCYCVWFQRWLAAHAPIGWFHGPGNLSRRAIAPDRPSRIDSTANTVNTVALICLRHQAHRLWVYE